MPREEMTEHMRLGWQLAASSTLINMPDVPTRRDSATLETWSQTTLGEWLHHKSRALAAASRELDAAAEEEPRQRIMGGAIVGLIYENAAQSMLSIPIPDELADEPAIADAYRDVVAFNASPYLERARAAYRACAANARIHEEEMGAAWASFCSGRLRLLPPSRVPPADATEF